MESVWADDGAGRRVVVGGVRKYVGATARSMGGDEVWVAYPKSQLDTAVVCSRKGAARDYVITCHRKREALWRQVTISRA